MKSLNEVKLIGNAGKDPEVRYLESGVAVATFSLATGKQWKDRETGEKKEVTQWHNLVAWRGLAEVVEKYVKKGTKIYVNGELQTRTYEKDGVKRYITEVVIDDLILLSSKDGGGSQAPPAPSEEDFVGPESESDVLPF
jgi:single-strand DNA-binding protein